MILLRYKVVFDQDFSGGQTKHFTLDILRRPGINSLENRPLDLP